MLKISDYDKIMYANAKKTCYFTSKSKIIKFFSFASLIIIIIKNVKSNLFYMDCYWNW